MSGAMFVLGIAGWSGAGKTTLIERLIPVLTGRGLTVSTIKHAHHAVDPDTPGKDSHRHRLAGAAEVMLATRHLWALTRTHGAEPEPDLPALLARMAPVDLVLVEGFKRGAHPRIEVRRAGHTARGGDEPLWAGDPGIVAVAADAAQPGCPLPVLPLDDVDAIADFVMSLRRRSRLRAVGG